MPQSLANVIVHLVFSTKQRTPCLTAPVRNELFPYLTGVFNNLQAPLLQLGGTEDHVHLLFTISRTHSIAQCVEKIKTSSSKFLKTKGLPDFAWQAGYGAFSVSPSDADAVIQYIQNQEAHHHKVTFQEEYRLLLQLANLPLDERYVWD